MGLNTNQFEQETVLTGIWDNLKQSLFSGFSSDPAKSKPELSADFDTSYWRTDDKAWMAERRSTWAGIEPTVLTVVEAKKFLAPIKAYYLRGQIPDWDKGQAKYDPKPHLNLFLFLWLHPSRDESVLNQLRQIYVGSSTVWHRDVSRGYFSFLASQRYGQTLDYASEPKYEHYPRLQGYGELFFRVLFVNPQEREWMLENYQETRITGSPGKIRYREFAIPRLELTEMLSMNRWLKLEKLAPSSEEFLYQYDDALNYWYQDVRGVNYFDQGTNRKGKIYWYKTLYPFHHFDTDREGDTVRSRFVFKIRKLLDDGIFDEHDEMWDDVKNDRIEIEDPWGY